MALSIEASPEIRRLEIIAKQLVNSKLVGNYKSAFKGRGIEFDGYREYSQADDAGKIDWRASMRSGGKILVKEFVEERNLDVGFLIDASDTMVLGSARKLKNEYASELVASLAYVMLEAGDSVGIGMFSGRTHSAIPPKGGLKHYYSLLHAMMQSSAWGGAKDWGGMGDYALQSFDRGSLVFIISDFIGMDAGFLLQLKVMARKFDVVGLCVRDPRDCTLPKGTGSVYLQDAATGEQILVDVDNVAGEYEKIVTQELSLVRQSFLQAGWDFAVFDSSAGIASPLRELFGRRMRRSG